MQGSIAVLVNIGDIIEGDVEHIRSLARNGLVEIVEEERRPVPPTPDAPPMEMDDERPAPDAPQHNAKRQK